MINKYQIEQALLFQKKLLEEYRKEAAFLPEGTLYFFNRKNQTQVYHCHNGNRTRLYPGSKTDCKYINQFRRKKCVLSSIQVLEANVKGLEYALKNYNDYKPNEIYNSMPNGYQTISWYFSGVPAPTKESYLRATKGCEFYPKQENKSSKETKLYKPEYLTIASGLGFNVRSKSEALIANILNAKGIEFEYETELVINNILYHPDFLFKTRSGRNIIWEHLGLSDDPIYIKKTSTKLADYLSEGYEFGKTLFITSELDNSPLDFQLVADLADLVKIRIAEN